MTNQAKSYDIFKLLVAILLLVVFLLFWLRPPQPSGLAALPSATAIQESTTTPQPATPTPQPSATLPPPTGTPTLTATTAPTATPTTAATSTATAGLTATPTLEAPTPTSTTAFVIAQPTVACVGPLPSRLQVGGSARVTTYLNMRSEPGMTGSVLLSNPTDTRLKIIGGPVCLAHLSSTYIWWQVQRQDGQSGWSAEASLEGGFYFLEPVP